MNNEECLICMNNMNVSFVILHENSSHKLCKSCYEKLRDPFCPFCRCNIKLHENVNNKLSDALLKRISILYGYDGLVSENTARRILSDNSYYN
jgi:hypothetical protein